MKNALSPRSILITGASSGLGKALALHYAREGIFLALSGQNEERLLQVAAECRVKGAEVDTIVLSVTDEAGMHEWVQRADDHRVLDLVIANAGISGGTGGHAGGEDSEQARQIFDVNLYGVLNTIHPILPRMAARGAGQIAVISSLAGFRGMPGAPAYSASKGAVRFYGEALRGSVRETGVKINVICPGFIRSRITDANNFPMPFFMEGEKAASIIAKSLAADKGRITFPWPMYVGTWLMSILPDSMAQNILAKLPAKS